MSLFSTIPANAPPATITSPRTASNPIAPVWRLKIKTKTATPSEAPIAGWVPTSCRITQNVAIGATAKSTRGLKSGGASSSVRLSA